MSETRKRLPLPQPVRLLCADDVVRDPASGRLARIVENVEDDARHAFFRAVDVESGESVALALRRTSRFVVYIY